MLILKIFFKKLKKIILIYFKIKNTLKNNYYNTTKTLSKSYKPVSICKR